MATWPLLDSGLGHLVSANLATSLADVTVTGSATIHTKGAWAELIAATAYDSVGMIFRVLGTSVAAADTSTLMDIGVGAAAAEVVVLPDFTAGYGNNGTVYVPLHVPAGSRVAARLQSLVASKAASLEVRMLYGGGVSPPDALRRAVTYGADTALSRGVILTAPAAVNTKGAWAEVVAATTARGRWAVVTMAGVGTAVTAADSLVDIGVGAATAEVVVLPDCPVATTASESMSYIPASAPVYIPAGSRLAARYQSTSIAAGARPLVTVTLLD